MIDPSFFPVLFLFFGAGILCGVVLSQRHRYPLDAPVTDREREWYREVSWWPGMTDEVETRLLKAMTIEELGQRGKDMVKLARINKELEKIFDDEVEKIRP